MIPGNNLNNLFIFEKIFNKIKAGGDKLKGTAKFTSQISILLNGYYNMGLAIKKLLSSSNSNSTNNDFINQQNAKKFFNNGYKLAQKYLTPEHILYKKLEEYSKHRSEEIINLDTSYEDQNEAAHGYQAASHRNKPGKNNDFDQNDYSDEFDNSVHSGIQPFNGARGFNNNSAGNWRHLRIKRPPTGNMYIHNGGNIQGRPFSAQSQSTFFQRVRIYIQ